MRNGAASAGALPDGFVQRARLLDLPGGMVEDYQRGAHAPLPEDYCNVYQVCLPYRGVGFWQVQGRNVVADANQVLFVRRGEPFRMSGPVPGGYAELILTLDEEILCELLRTESRGLFEHPLFRRRSALATPVLHVTRTRFLHDLRSKVIDELAAEERVLMLLRAALQPEVWRTHAPSPSTERLVERAKQFIVEHLPQRLRLCDIARGAGASPAYLTHVFSVVEGRPLHRYVTQLRLARALEHLAHTDDLTRLALATGFSSHSHFTSVFRRAFGCTPSQFRERARRVP